MSNDKIFADGFIAKRHDNSPDFVITGLSVKVDEAVAFLQEYQKDGWVNLQVKRSKGGKPYVELDTWRPTQGESAQQGMAQAKAAAEPQGGDFSDDIPFSNYEHKGWA